MKISYGYYEDGWAGFENLIKNYALKENAKKICDVGGGANPLLSPDFITEHQLDYSIIDLSSTELQKVSDEYKKIIIDICQPDLILPDKYDLVFSKMLAEHLRSPLSFHKNIFNMLSSGGKAIHFFPTLYTLPFIVNKILPDAVSKILMNLFIKRDDYRHPKFKAYYLWCRGPTHSQITKFADLGYTIVEYIGYFGHNGYRRLPLIQRLEEWKTHLLLSHPNPWLTSFAVVILAKKSGKNYTP